MLHVASHELRTLVRLHAYAAGAASGHAACVRVKELLNLSDYGAQPVYKRTAKRAIGLASCKQCHFFARISASYYSKCLDLYLQLVILPG